MDVCVVCLGSRDALCLLFQEIVCEGEGESGVVSFIDSMMLMNWRASSTSCLYTPRHLEALYSFYARYIKSARQPYSFSQSRILPIPYAMVLGAKVPSIEYGVQSIVITE